MFDWLFGKKESEEDIQAEKLVQYLNRKYEEDFSVSKSTVYDNDGEKRISSTLTSQELEGKSFEADAECGSEELSDCSDGYIYARYRDRLKSYADEILDQVFSHYTSVLDADNMDPDNPDWSGVVDFDTFIKEYEDCTEICFTVITDMDKETVEAAASKLLKLIKDRKVRFEILVNLVPSDRYQEESDRMISKGDGNICTSSLYYVFVDYFDEQEDIEFIEKKDNE